MNAIQARTHSLAGVALLFGASLALPHSVHAESALLMPGQGEDASEALREQAQAALRAALEAQGVRVIGREEAVRRLPSAEGRDCARLDCAPALLGPAGVDFATGVVLWQAAGAAAPRTVLVTLVGVQGTRYPGSATVDGAKLDDAVRSALNDARGLQLLGPGPWLRVRGTPEGAEVWLDGTLVGSVPYRTAVTSGAHTLEVRAEGFAPLIRAVTVPPNVARQLDVDVALQGKSGAADEANAPAAASTGEPATQHVRPVWGPLLLGTAGLALLTVDLVLVLKDGCEVESQGTCLVGNQTPTGAAVAWGALGGGALVGAVLWHVFGGRDVPVDTRVDVAPASSGFRLDVRQRF